MVSWIISRLVVLIFGTLYPAYYSYKAVKSKDIKEYVKWMMYWIIFALFTTAETFTDIFLCWFPFYYELKIAFVAWLLSPYTKGSSLLYRKFVHPTLSSKEKEIDDCLIQAKDRSYDALVHFGKRGLNVAATAAVMAASKVSQLLHLHLYLDQKKGQGQGALSERLRSFSMQDLSTIRGDSSSTVPPSVTVRTSSKQSHPKPSRSASEGTGSSVCTCCSVCRLLRAAEGLKDDSVATMLQPPVPSHSPAPGAGALGSAGAWGLQPDTASLHPAWVASPPSHLICYASFPG
uniref:Receptor expression-enhancing protein n=1 Tax=Ficedula albicollis TaxID=59894 RepID=A0A803WFP5_FICAL